MRHTIRFATVALTALLTIATAAHAEDGPQQHVLLTASGLEIDASRAEGTWVSTREGLHGDNVDLLQHVAPDGGLSRMAVALIPALTCNESMRALEARSLRRFPAPSLAGLHPAALLSRNGLLTFCLDTMRGELVMTTSIVADTAHASARRSDDLARAHGETIGLIYVAARDQIGIPGVASAAPAPSDAPGANDPALPSYFAPTPSPSSATLAPGYRYFVPTHPPLRGEPFGLVNTAAIGGSTPIHSSGEPNFVFTYLLSVRAPSAFEVGIRADLSVGFHEEQTVGFLAGGAFVALHPLALMGHHRFDPSISVGIEAIIGAGSGPYNNGIDSFRGIMAPIALNFDVRVIDGLHIGPYAEVDLISALACGSDPWCYTEERAVYMRATFGVRFSGSMMR